MDKPAINSQSYVGRHLIYPKSESTRQAEGGRRLAGTSRESRAGKPLVSVITVCWNSDCTIEQTIRSVANQTYDNVEHLIVDGGSTDRTLEIIRKYESEIDYYVSESDMGLYFAMNKGLELAQGEYILILNSDDWYAPTCIEILLEAKKKTGADFVSSMANYVDEKGKFLRLQPSFPFDMGIYFRMPLRHETMLLSREIYEKYGPYDTRYFINADRALSTKLFEAGLSHFEVEQPLMFFRDTGVSSTDMGKLFKERERMVSRHFPGLSTPDVEVLARLHLMRPQRMVSIARNYGCADFSQAALDYGRHRAAGATNEEWKTFDFSELEALVREHTSAHAHSEMQSGKQLRNIATLSTSDHGGAGIGSQRRVEALRRRGLNAEIYCVFRKTQHAHVDQMIVNLPGAPRLSEAEVRKAWRDAAVVTREDIPDMSAREMFSKAGSIIDFRDNRAALDQADIVHLHWVVGMLDLDNLGSMLRDKPVAWTLADMNAFTGGCHYSEGCTEYRNECKNCPLLGSDKAMAHETWKAKNAAYKSLKNLHIICPSQWLADCAKQSSLFRDRPVHMIPNALPVNRFTPTSRLIARQRLGLPLDKKLMVFGADNVTNKRKGGDILAAAIRDLRAKGAADNIEGVFFGENSLDLDMRTYNMGHVSDENKMSLIYAAADVFAFPSREDNAPLTVVEAMLSGTPVVGFPVGNVPELVNHLDTGYIARYADAQDFAEGLIWALRDVDSVEYMLRGLRGHLKARAHNDPDLAVGRHIELYRKMLGEKYDQNHDAST